MDKYAHLLEKIASYLPDKDIINLNKIYTNKINIKFSLNDYYDYYDYLQLATKFKIRHHSDFNEWGMTIFKGMSYWDANYLYYKEDEEDEDEHEKYLTILKKNDELNKYRKYKKVVNNFKDMYKKDQHIKTIRYLNNRYDPYKDEMFKFYILGIVDNDKFTNEQKLQMLNKPNFIEMTSFNEQQIEFLKLEGYEDANEDNINLWYYIPYNEKYDKDKINKFGRLLNIVYVKKNQNITNEPPTFLCFENRIYKDESKDCLDIIIQPSSSLTLDLEMFIIRHPTIINDLGRHTDIGWDILLKYHISHTKNKCDNLNINGLKKRKIIS